MATLSAGNGGPRRIAGNRPRRSVGGPGNESWARVRGSSQSRKAVEREHELPAIMAVLHIEAEGVTSLRDMAWRGAFSKHLLDGITGHDVDHQEGKDALRM